MFIYGYLIWVFFHWSHGCEGELIDWCRHREAEKSDPVLNSTWIWCKHKSQSASVYVQCLAKITDVAVLLLYCSRLLSTPLYIDLLFSVNRFSKNPSGALRGVPVIWGWVAVSDWEQLVSHPCRCCYWDNDLGGLSVGNCIFSDWMSWPFCPSVYQYETYTYTSHLYSNG